MSAELFVGFPMLAPILGGQQNDPANSEAFEVWGTVAAEQVRRRRWASRFVGTTDDRAQSEARNPNCGSSTAGNVS
jgi:hypothetical protein